MKKIYYFLLLLCVATHTSAQDRLEFKQLGFAIDAPKDWFKAQEDGLEQNLSKHDLTYEQRAAIIESLNAASKLVTYYKYDLKKTEGIIPTINIVIRVTNAKSFLGFKTHIDKSINEMKKLLQNFEASEPKVLEIDNSKLWTISTNYDYKNAKGTTVKINTKVIYIYKGEYYITINFIEDKGKEDNSELFEATIKSIKLTNVPLQK